MGCSDTAKVSTRKLGMYAATAVVGAGGFALAEGALAAPAFAYTADMHQGSNPGVTCAGTTDNLCSYPAIHKLSNAFLSAKAGVGYHLCIGYTNSVNYYYQSCATYDVHTWRFPTAATRYKAADGFTSQFRSIFWNAARVDW